MRLPFFIIGAKYARELYEIFSGDMCTCDDDL